MFYSLAKKFSEQETRFEKQIVLSQRIKESLEELESECKQRRQLVAKLLKIRAEKKNNQQKKD